MARERHPDGVLSASREAHYSVPEDRETPAVPCVAVDVDERGAMDLAALGREIGSRGVPAIVVATIGTTGRSAVDDIPGIRWAASDAGQRGVRPFGRGVRRAARRVRAAAPGVAWAATTTRSGGSRDALSPLLLSYALRGLGRDELAGRVRHCPEVTEHAVRRLAEAGLDPTRFSGGDVVLSDRPDEEVMSTWPLHDVDGRAHLSVMPHVTTDLVDQFCADLTGGRA